MQNSPLAAGIEDPDFYLDDPWSTFRSMQEDEPFSYYEPLDTFVVTKHAHIVDITKRPTTFVNSRGIFLNDVKYQDQAGGESIADSFFPKGGEQVGFTDPPRHTELRRVLAPAFTPSALNRMTAAVESHCAQLLDEIEPGAATDWMPIAGSVPVHAASRLIGLPDSDHDRVVKWSDELEKLGGDLSYDELQAAAKEFTTLQGYIAEKFEEKHGNPGGEDLLTVLMNAELDDERVSEANVIMFAMTMIAAGSDTTRALLAGLALMMARHPDQWDALRADRSLIGGALDETLRWVTPARAFLRTAATDAEVDGHRIGEGQHVYLMYMAANRDPEIFADPFKYDITRPNAAKHLALSSGAHVCAGARLVRHEGTILLNAMLDRFSRIEVVAEPDPVRHVLRNSWTTMPLRFHS